MNMYEIASKGDKLLYVGENSLAPIEVTVVDAGTLWATTITSSGREILLHKDMYFGLVPHQSGAFFKSKGPALAYMATRARRTA